MVMGRFAFVNNIIIIWCLRVFYTLNMHPKYAPKSFSAGQTVQTSDRPPSQFLSTVIFHANIISGSPQCLAHCQIRWKYLKSQPSWWKILSTAPLTLNFDLDLSKDNNDISSKCCANFHANRICSLFITFIKRSSQTFYNIIINVYITFMQHLHDCIRRTFWNIGYGFSCELVPI